METPTKKAFLHVGCGPKRQDQTTREFAKDTWRELRLDIAPEVAPDLVGTITDMAACADASMDAVYSSHNLEHLYPHEVPLAMAEFHRVLKPEGYLVITCPDLQAACALVAEDKLLETAYTAPAGPVAPLDMLYGFRRALAAGNIHMAHHCGFTQRALTGVLQAAGFSSIAAMRRPNPFYDIWAVATLAAQPEEVLRQLVAAHFPG